MIPNSISLIIIYYNQEHLIGDVEQTVLGAAKHFDSITLVDNGSIDKTAEALLKIASKSVRISVISLPENLHIGGSIKHVLAKKTYDWIGWVHGDMLIDESFYLKAKEIISSDHDVKCIKAKRRGRRFSEYFFTTCLGYCASTYLRLWLQDISAIPCFIHKELKPAVLQHSTDDYTFDLAVYTFAKYQRLKIRKIPVSIGDPPSAVSTWNRDLNGYVKMIMIWVQALIHIKSSFRQTKT